MGIGWIGFYTPLIILLYLFMIRMLFVQERQQQGQALEDTEAELNYEHMSLRRVYLGYAIAAVFVIGAGTWLAFVGKDIAEATGWGESFVGSLFIAITTSLPEVAVSFSALRLGAVDMGVANMIGSNLFNMAIIGIDDIFYRQGPVLAAVSESHIYTGLVVLVMTGIVIAGFFFRRQYRRPVKVSWYVPVMIAVYLAGAYISFTMGD
jgi:cation:H+ antiporter